MSKICMVAYTSYMNDTRVRREAEALAARGHRVDVVCLGEADGSRQREHHGVRLYHLHAGRYRGDSTLGYLLGYICFFVQAFILVAFLFLKNRYAIIQVHTMPDFMVFTAALPKWLGAKVILDVHDLMPELYLSKFGSGANLYLVRFIVWVERRSIAFADKAIAVHAPHCRALVRHGNPASKMTVLLNVPDSRVFQPTRGVRTDSRFRLAYHGMVARRHGLEVAIRAIRALNDRIPGLELLIIGDGDDLQRIKALVWEWDLRDSVRFMAPMPPERLSEHLAQVDVGLVPILHDSFTRYMLPTKLLEYVWLGIPAIVSRTETIEEYFDDSMVCFVRPGDVGELAQRILELYATPQKRKELASNAAKFNDLYNWNEQKKTYFQLIDELA